MCMCAIISKWNSMNYMLPFAKLLWNVISTRSAHTITNGFHSACCLLCATQPFDILPWHTRTIYILAPFIRVCSLFFLHNVHNNNEDDNNDHNNRTNNVLNVALHTRILLPRIPTNFPPPTYILAINFIAHSNRIYVPFSQAHTHTYTQLCLPHLCDRLWRQCLYMDALYI